LGLRDWGKFCIARQEEGGQCRDNTEQFRKKDETYQVSDAGLAGLRCNFGHDDGLGVWASRPKILGFDGKAGKTKAMPPWAEPETNKRKMQMPISQSYGIC
jgi:hypothetical protein